MELAARLRGETEAEIRKDADALVRLAGTQKRPYVAPLAAAPDDRVLDPKTAAWREMLDGLKAE